MPTMSKEEIETEEETVVSEEEATVEEVVAEEETVEEVNIEDDVNALLGGEELSEEFREKAKVIFEVLLSDLKLKRSKNLSKNVMKRDLLKN